MTLERRPAVSITTSQYLAALDALGLDPQLTQAVTITSTVVSVASLATDEDGHVLIELGQPVVEHASHTILTEGDPS